MTIDVQLSFSNNFWGMKDEGYNVLTSKMNNSKRTFDEIKSFYSVRASLHEEFGRKLMKHCKNGMGKEENGTLNELLVSAHKEMEQSAKIHLGVASKLKTRLEVELDNFILEQKERRKLMQTNVEKAFRTKKLNENQLLRQREKYEADYVKLHGLKKQLQSATTIKDEERLKIKVERTQHEIKIQEQEYRNACIKLADATEAWNQTWKIACDVYQGMEKKRLEFLYYSFSMYINIISTGTSEDQESYERFWKYLDKYDPIGDMQSFITQKKTGPKIPEAEMFVDYNDDPEKRQIKHHLADFELPVELTSTPITPLKPKLTVRNPSSRSNKSDRKEHDDDDDDDDDDEKKEEKPHQHYQVLYEKEKANEEEQLEEEEEDQMTPFIEPPMPSNNMAERRKSIQSIKKPLPSASVPSQLSKSNSTASSIFLKRQSSESQRRGVDGIYISPTRAATTSNITSNRSINTTMSKRSSSTIKINNNTKNGSAVAEEDIKIDPRAKVVFSIGNNMFDLGHLTNESRDDFNRQTKKKEEGISRSNRKKQNSVDIDAASKFEYHVLLKDLGVFDTKEDEYHHAQKNKRNESSKRTVVQSGVVAGTLIKDEKAILDEISPEPTNYYTENYYYQRPSSSDAYHSNDRYYQQPSGYTTPANNGQTILFWGQALADWHSSDPEQLQFTRGTWLGITDTRADGWHYAIKYDSRSNTFTNEKGYVAQNYMQIIRP